MTFEQRIEKYIDQQALFSHKENLLIALSGGADSVALLRALLSLGYSCKAVHCNFHLRAEESDHDELFVRKLCKKLSVPLHVAHFNTSYYAAERRISIEMAARELRYTHFEELRIQQRAAVVAVAHHRDDSVETLLLNLIRGTGIGGLQGIRPKNGYIVRPLLEISRKEIISFLDSIQQDYVTDSTNLQDEYIRNKIRLNVLPLMAEINPSIMQSIANTADALHETAGVYKKAIAEACERVTNKREQSVSIPLLLQEASPKAVLFEIFYPMGFNSAQIEDIYQSLHRESGRCFTSKSWRLLKDRSLLIFRPYSKTSDITINKEISFPEKLNIPYNFNTPNGKFIFRRHAYTKEFCIPKEKNKACIDIASLAFPLKIRLWSKGDKFTPYGMKGQKLVSDYLTDNKCTLYQKEKQLVVCDANGRIVWLAGERIDNNFRISDSTKEILIIEINS